MTLNITRNPKKCEIILNKGRDNMTSITVTRDQICASGGPGKDTCNYKNSYF